MSSDQKKDPHLAFSSGNPANKLITDARIGSVVDIKRFEQNVKDVLLKLLTSNAIKACTWSFHLERKVKRFLDREAGKVDIILGIKDDLSGELRNIV